MATPNERFIYGAKTDSVDLMQEVLNGQEQVDVNHQDGLGNTALLVAIVLTDIYRLSALHYAASTPSPDALTLLLDLDDLDVDLQNRLDRFTPLHMAVRLENEAARMGVMEMLLDAGADPSLKDRHGLRPQDYLRPTQSETDKEIAQMIRVAMSERTMGATSTVNNADLAGDDDDDDGEPGSGSDSE
ncbi:hypothetical protein BMF94_1097 [Rhodotorula taiwanensis]|uniref:Uncharacterized protein n=1 Tax=Rhodotorula taiwanensis TaxID=741276 RepID=A0A2S5BG91_9BASI|nr:hypothetical protein BMF94_1097 [Rhodotorula taiwanensis]